MKTQTCTKILSAFLMFSAVHATASVVTINSNHTDYTFASGTTYFVDANVTLSGTTTFEGGAILKFNGSGQINIDSGGAVVCPTGTDSAIFTSYNDNTVGETVSGSSGTPAAEDVYTFLNCSGTLSNLRFYYGEWPLPANTTVTLQNCQFFHGEYLYLQTSQIINNLFVGVYIDWFPSADVDLMRNNTFVSCPAVICDSSGFAATVKVSDNLFDTSQPIDWTSLGTIGGNNALYDCTDYLGGNAGLPTDIILSSALDYQTGSYGSYYLPQSSPLIDAGDISASDAGLNSFTTQTDQTTDSGIVDIGYHYPFSGTARDYVELDSNQTNFTFRRNTTYFIDANITLYGTTTFKSGAVLKYNSSGQINIDSSGTVVCPTSPGPAIFTSYNDNTVGVTIPGSSGTPGIYNMYTDSGNDVNTFLVYSGTLSNMRFSYAYNPLGWYATATVQDCQFFYDAYMYVQTSQLFDDLFVDVYIDWFPTANNSFMQNNTFVSCPAVILDYGDFQPVIASDNLFDSSQVLDWTDWGSTGGNNAFYNCADYLGGNAGLPTDITLSSEPAYQTGPLGSYYLPSDSSLIDAGDMSASDAGLDSFTTQTSQTPDSGTVDIGYHYPLTGYVVIDSDKTDYTFESGTTYFVDANVTLYGTTTFEGGAILKYNGSGQLNIDSGGTVVCPSGVEPAVFTSYNDDSVGVTIWGSSGTPAAEDVNTFLNSFGTLSNLRFFYGAWPLAAYATVDLENCEFFYGENLYLQTSHIINNLFVGVYIDWFPSTDDSDDNDVDYDWDDDNLMVNNTFVNCPAVIFDSSGFSTSVIASDNLFDSSQPIDWTSLGTVGDNNALYNCSDYLGGNVGLPTDITLSSEPAYQTGPLGSYYLPSDSPLLGAGDISIEDMILDGLPFALDTFTTQTDQSVNDTGPIDIGYHYFINP